MVAKSRALKTRQGTFTVQWQRAHIDAPDIKSANHDMAIVFGNERADAMAKQAANEAALRGAAAEPVAWVDALAWQVQRRITVSVPSQPHCLDSSGERSQEVSDKNCPSGTFRAHHTSIGISTFQAAVGMSNL